MDELHNTLKATSLRDSLTRLQTFANIQASRFARHPGCSYRIKVYTYQGSRGFYFHAYLGLLPPRAVDMLAVRNRVTDGVGTFTPLDSRPCWPLPQRCHNIFIRSQKLWHRWGQRPSPRREWLGTQQYLRTATSVRSGFSGLQSFDDLQAR